MKRTRIRSVRLDVALWITILRGLFAIALGLALLFNPEKSTRILGNFVGAFWIGTGILSTRWGLSDKRSKPLTLFVGTVAILAGALMFTRYQIGRWVPEDLIVNALGVIAILTGLLHLSGRMRVNRFQHRHVARSGFTLGVFEIALGLVLLLSGRGGTLVVWIGLGWALVGGVTILGDAYHIYRQSATQLTVSGSSMAVDVDRQ